MFFDKVQAGLMKDAVKRDLAIGKGFTHKYGYYKDNVVVSNADCYVLYLIPKDKFYLNIDTVFRDTKPINFEKILKVECEASDLKFTDNIKQTYKLMLNVLMNGDEIIYLDSKLLNAFKSKYRTLAFKGTNGKSPVFVYDGETEELLGCILPVYVK